MEKISLYALGSIGSLALLALACSAESATPEGGTGGSNGVSGSTGSGGTTATFGGATASSGGTSTGLGGTSSTSGGAATTMGGATSMGGGTATSGGASTTSGGSTGTMGGSTGTSGGSTATTGGSAGAGTTGGTASAGSSGSGGAVTACSDGCAELKVPFTAYKSAQAFEIYLAAPVDFSTGVVSVKIRATAGKAGGVQVVIKNPSANMYAWAQTAWAPISDLNKADWTTLTLNAATPSSATTDTTYPFNKAQVSIITIQVSAGDPWYSDTAMTMVDQAALVNPTTLLVDEITVAGATGAGPWPFTMNVTDLKVGEYMPVTGSTCVWLPPG